MMMSRGLKYLFDKNNCYFLSKQENEEIFGIYLNDILSFKTINLKENNVLLRQEYEFILPIGCSLKEKGYYMTSIADGIFGLNNNMSIKQIFLITKELFIKIYSLYALIETEDIFL